MRSLPQVRRFIAIFAASLAALSLSFSAIAAEDSKERAAMLASQAEKILNTWTGQDEAVVPQAEKLIEQALALDPDSGHAMVEKGRAVLMSDPYSNGYSRAEAVKAEALFLRATRLNPPYGRGFVLLGHLYTEVGNLEGAREALTKADTLVPNDPWLKLNWGALYQAQGRPEMMDSYAQQAIATGTTNPKALKAAYGILLTSAMKKGDRAKADEYYEKGARIQRNDAWTRGNYAQNVMLYFGDFEAGERLAREALDIMDYGHARGSLSLALYGKFAQAERDGKPLAVQEALFDTASKYDPGGHYLPSCAMKNKRVGFVFDAIFKKGIERQSLRQC